MSLCVNSIDVMMDEAGRGRAAGAFWMSESDARVTAMKAGVAAIMGCMVDTMEHMHPGSRELFLRKIGEACATLRNSEHGQSHEAIEMVMWAGQLVSGWHSMRQGSGPFVR